MRRWGQFPSERDWERSVLLTPAVVPWEPELISDGAGPPFPPSALRAPAGGLAAGDPVVDAFAAALRRQAKAPPAEGSLLNGWRMLARTEDEALLARGAPPEMTTVLMRRESRRSGWRSTAVTRGAVLRVSRDGIRASHWRLDESHPLEDGDAVIRILVTEQTRSGGMLADKRLLTPDIHERDDEVLLRVFVTPRSGIQMASAKVETPVRIQLPSPIGARELIDGALYDPE